MRRYYFAPKIGAGATAADAVRPAIALSFGVVDGRDWMFGGAEVTDPQHAANVAVANVAYLPIEDAGGVVLAVDGRTVANVAPANRTTIRDLLEARHVPAHALTLATPLRRVLRLVEARAVLRQTLGVDDLTEGLDTTLGAMTAARRQAVRAKLIAAGLDFDFATLATTVRAFIMGLYRQNASVVLTSTPEDG